MLAAGLCKAAEHRLLSILGCPPFCPIKWLTKRQVMRPEFKSGGDYTRDLAKAGKSAKKTQLFDVARKKPQICFDHKTTPSFLSFLARTIIYPHPRLSKQPQES